MQVKIFNIPLSDDGTYLAELNKFISANKVLEVEQQFFQNEKGACWSFCLRYIANSSSYNSFGASKTKVDYKNILSEADFDIFSQLREIRKEIAMFDAVPAYAVFTDEELGLMAKIPELTLGEMQKIKGIGAKKIEKYGKPLLEKFIKIKETNETGK